MSIFVEAFKHRSTSADVRIKDVVLGKEFSSMHVLQLPFKLLTYTGIWMPVDWKLPRQKFAYVLFSIFCNGLYLMTHFSMLGYLMMARSWEEFSDRLFLIPTGVSGVHKLAFILTNRRKIADLANSLLEKYCQPRNGEELAIQNKYDETVRVITIACACLVNVTMMNLVALPLLPSSSNHTLPLNVWLPYSIKSKLSYWITYAHQTFGILLVGTSAVGSTIMINGFLFQACAQFELLSHRFYKLPKVIEKLRKSEAPEQFICEFEKKAMKENVRHHLFIFSFAETFNDIFQSVIFQQFCISSIVVSVSVYQLSTRPEKNMEFMMCFFYLICVLTEFLVYCWFGNEVMFESYNFQDSVYATDWTSLSTSTCRDLVLVTLRASRPIVICCGHFIVLSLESYIGILRISYSVFNILRRSSD